MSFAQTQDAKEQVRQAIDIVDLVGRAIPLRRQGRIYLGLCPWHDDTRPSLQVNPDRQSWKCWVCDVGGDIFSFVMKQENVGFREALEMLAERAGVQLDRGPAQARAKPGDPGDKRTLYQVTAWAEQQFRQCLLRAPEAEAARRYFAERGISADAAARFHLGFSPDQWQWLLNRARSASFSTALLEAAGLLSRSSKSGDALDFFRGRVIFPIRDTQSRVLGFGGRLLPGSTAPTGKYINSRDTRLFSKSEHVYGLDQARESDAVKNRRHIAVVEGYTDVIMAHQCGLNHFVAVLGTALGAGHLRLLRRYAESITLVLDGDQAGQRRAGEVLELFVAGELDLRIATLPDGLDPCDFLLQRGGDAMQELLDAAPDAFDHAFQTLTRGVDLVRDTHRANRALEQLLAMISKAPRLTGASSSSKVVRERQMVARMAREFRVDEGTLRSRIGELRRARPASRPSGPAGEAPRVRLSDLHPYEVELFEILAIHPGLADMAIDELGQELAISQPGRAIYDRYRAVLERGEPAQFARVLAELEDPDLKNLLVAIDEGGALKQEHAQEDAPARLRRLIDDIRYRDQEAQRRQAVSALEQRACSHEEEMDILEQLAEQERRRQGIPAPTDG